MTDGAYPWVSGHRRSVWRSAKARRAFGVTVSFVTLCSVLGLVFVGFLENDTLASNGGARGSIEAKVAAPDPSAMALAPRPAIAPSTVTPGKPYGASVNPAWGGRQLASLSAPLNLGASLLTSSLGPPVTSAAHSTSPTVTPATTTGGGAAPPPTATKPVTSTTTTTTRPPATTTTTTTQPPVTTTTTTTTQAPATTTTTTTQPQSTTPHTQPTTVITTPIAPLQQLVTSLDIVPTL